MRTLFILMASLWIWSTGFSAAGNFTIDLFTGDVKISHNNGRTWQDADVDQVLAENDKVQTGGDSSCDIAMPNGLGTFQLEDNTTISMGQLIVSNKIVVSKGKTLFTFDRRLKPEESFEVETTTAVAAVRGTQFFIESEEGKDTVSVADGVVALRRNIDLKGIVNPGEIRALMTVNAEKDREIEFSAGDNQRLVKFIRENIKNRKKILQYLKNEKTELTKKIRMIKNKERLTGYLTAFQKNRLRRLIIRQEILKRKLMQKQKKNRTE
jgi:hypothetical protein